FVRTQVAPIRRRFISEHISAQHRGTVNAIYDIRDEATTALQLAITEHDIMDTDPTGRRKGASTRDNNQRAKSRCHL
ncbi:MAG: hypothetical protein ACRDL7_10825, partial [Gaiellaceae bacterium]